MNELIKFGALAAILLVAMKAIARFSEWLANRGNLNQKFVGYVVAFIVFIVCIILWNFTPVYDYISQLTGVPLER